MRAHKCVRVCVLCVQVSSIFLPPIHSEMLLSWDDKALNFFPCTHTSHTRTLNSLPLQVREIVLSGGRPDADSLPVVPHYRELMCICWDQDPENRPSFKQVRLCTHTHTHALQRAHVYLLGPGPRE